MKKRILAFALTLAMVVGSLSMLSFVTFAEDVQNPPAATDFYAYRSNAKVDGALASDECFTPVYKELAPCAAIGMAWDYDNLYFILYQEPSSDGVAGARKDYFTSAVFTVCDSLVITADFAAGTVTTNDVNSKAYGKTASTYGLEIAVPLAELTLDVTQLEAGVAAVPVNVVLNQKYLSDAEPKQTADKDYNVILSGRTLITQMDSVNATNSIANGYNMLFENLHFTLSGTAHVFDSTFTSSNGTGKSGKWQVVDATTRDGNYLLGRKMHHVAEYVNVNAGGSNNLEFALTIDNLPVNGDKKITAHQQYNGANNEVSHIQIVSAGFANNANSALVTYIYNDKTTGLTLAYYDSNTSSFKYVDLGVELGEEFVLGINEIGSDNGNGTIEWLVNDKVIETYQIYSLPSVVMNNRIGTIQITYKRGHSGLGTNGFSLDLNENGVIDDNEKVGFTMKNATLSKVNEVDIDMLKSLTKNGGATPSAKLLAIAGDPDKTETVNVGSVSKAYAYYDFENEVVKLAINNANLNKLNVNLGGFKASVTYKWTNKGTNSGNLGCEPVLDITSANAGATVSTAFPYNVTIITIPMEKIVITKNGDIAEATLDICAINEVQWREIKYEDDGVTIKNDTTRRLNQIEGDWNGTLVFAVEPIVENVIELGTITGFSSALSITAINSGTHGVSYDNENNVITFADSSDKTGVRQCITGKVSNMASFGDREISFTVNIASLNAYDFTANPYTAKPHGTNANGIWGDANTPLAFDRFVFAPAANVTNDATQAGCMAVEIVNDTTKGLVLYHTDFDGNVTSIVLGDKLGEDIDLKFVWQKDNSLEIYVDDDCKAEISKGATVIAPTGKGCYMASGDAIQGLSGFHIVRSTATGNDGYNYFSATVTGYTSKLTEKQVTGGDWTVDDVVALGANAATTPAIRMSYVQETAIYDADESAEVTNNVINARFIATINTLDAKEAGFEIAVGENAAVKKGSNVVYTSLRQNIAGDLKMLSATDGEYLVAVVVKGIPATGTVTFTVRPYFIDLEDATQYGDAYVVTYTNGAFVSCVPAN